MFLPDYKVLYLFQSDQNAIKQNLMPGIGYVEPEKLSV